MARFFLIRKGSSDSSRVFEQNVYLEAACKELGVAYHEIEAATATVANLPTLEPGDMMYRNTSLPRAKVIERLIMQPGVATFYKDGSGVYAERRTSFFQNHQHGLPVIPTYPLLPQSREELNQAVEYVGGFPLIFKVMGSSKGVGVIKIDSLESFKSVADYFTSVPCSVLIRKFIPHTYYGRLIVIGDRVVASNRTAVPTGEFRSNTAENTDDNREPFIFDDYINSIAVQAVQSIGLEFGGVDVILAEDGAPFITEVNYPCQFEFAQRITGVDVAHHMVAHLLAKAS